MILHSVMTGVPVPASAGQFFLGPSAYTKIRMIYRILQIVRGGKVSRFNW